MSCISYLDTRTEFWQQQKPIYARERNQKLLQQQWNRTRNRPPSDTTVYVLKNLEEIDTGEILMFNGEVKVHHGSLMLLKGDIPQFITGHWSFQHGMIC